MVELQTTIKPKETAKNTFGKEQRRRKAELRNRIKQIENEVDQIGEEISNLEAFMVQPEIIQDYKKLEETCNSLESLKAHQQELLDEWEVLVIEQEGFETD